MNEKIKFESIFQCLRDYGKETSPRDMKVRELENFNYSLEPYDRFCSFEARKLNLDYIKQEFLWYLKGDKYDTSIIHHAKMWRDLVNKDGSINSNYGQYVFGDLNGFDDALDTLRFDKDSRRAIIPILNHYHLKMETKDVPCTISIGFRIRENKLNMTVRMRSQDAIFGMGNDAPAFSFIHEMMLNALKMWYPDLEMGSYYHSADSFHVYERHFEMMDKIVNGDKFTQIECPRINGPEEVMYLRNGFFRDKPIEEVPVSYQFTRWLLTPEEKNAVQLSGDLDKTK